MADIANQSLLIAVIAYGIGVFAAMLPIHHIVGLTWKLVEAESISDKPDSARAIHGIHRRYIWQGDLVGAVERLLYVTSILLGRSEFIAVWLTLKTVARSPRWTEEKQIKGRGLFNNFLIGNGLSIMYSFIGMAIATLALGPGGQRSLAGCVALTTAAVIGPAIAWIWLSRRLETLWSEMENKISPWVYTEVRGFPPRVPTRR